MILNCKVCGGTLEIMEGSSICKCEYCGKEQTLPKTDDEQVVNMLNRANHFRQVFEFDKAIEIYERLLDSGTEDAELYWNLALCRYGIEYVDDPVTKEKIPTCHRAQYKSMLEDADYLMALKCADSIQRNLYEKEARYIDQVQKGILEISNKEEPFDVFICYKESDGTGNRTTDSVLAQDIYYELVEKNYKVFFARITLEKVVGEQYEPYIFAALNSAKVMIVVGTKPEYYNAVWVKNEWNRFLSILRNDKGRLIIPAYKDMDPYDLPDALSYFQALDMSKIGFVQDLIRGIDKVLSKDDAAAKENRRTEGESGSIGNASALLKRGNFALEDGEWSKAYEYFDQVLNIDAEESRAYLGQALSNMRVSSLDELAKTRTDAFTQELRSFEQEMTVCIDRDKIEKVKSLASGNNILIADFIRELQEYQEVYISSVDKIKERISREEAFFAGDKTLGKASRFSDEIRQQITEAKEAIIGAMNASLSTAEQEAGSRREEAEKKADEFCNETYTHVVNVIEKKSKEYAELKQTYLRNGTNAGLRKLVGEFGRFKGYEDADEIYDRLKEAMNCKEEEIRKLKARETEIVSWEFANVSGFNKRKKIAALQKELDQIRSEVPRLKEALE